MNGDPIFVVKLISSLVLGGLVSLSVYMYTVFCVKPQKLRSRLQKQGIRGPSPSFLLGNVPEMKRIKLDAQIQSVAEISQKKDPLTITHDWPSTVFPHLRQWINTYGSTFIYSTGNVHLVCTTDIDMVKEINLCTSVSLGKPAYLSTDYGPLLGHSIFSANGPTWARHRRIIAPEFYIDKVKSMVGLMVDSTTSVLRSWENRIESGGGIADINIDLDLRCLSADIISRACFGSNYIQGEEIFLKIRTLQNILAAGYNGILFKSCPHACSA